MESLSPGTASQQVPVPTGQGLSCASESSAQKTNCRLVTMRLCRAARDRKLVTHLTVQVAPGIHQKTQTSAHLLAELQSSLSSQGMAPFWAVEKASSEGHSTSTSPWLCHCFTSPSKGL